MNIKRSINFYLADKNSITTTVIRASVHWKGIRLRFATGQSVNPMYWNAEKQRCIELKGKNENAELKKILKQINDFLERLQSKLNLKFDHSGDEDVIPSETDIRNLINDMVTIPKADKLPAVKSFLQYFEMFINETRDGKRKIEGRILERGSWKGYITTYNHLFDFQKLKKYHLSFDNMNKEFFNSFVGYLTEKGLTTNYQWALFRNLKTFIHYAVDQNWTGIKPDVSKIFKIKKMKSREFALSFGEMALLFNAKIENPKLDKTRNLFLIQCLTGLRYSDLAQLKPVHFKKEFIEIETEKTNTRVIIPIHQLLKSIIEKFPSYELNVYSSQKYNNYIKDVSRLCGIDTPEEKIRYIGSKRETTESPKYEFITSHCGRRTFVTLSRKLRIPDHFIKQTTGHVENSVFNGYDISDPYDVASEVGQAWDNFVEGNIPDTLKRLKAERQLFHLNNEI